MREPIRVSEVAFGLLFCALGAFGLWLAAGGQLPGVLAHRAIPVLLVLFGAMGLALTRRRRRRRRRDKTTK